MTPNSDRQVTAEAQELRRQARTLRSVADSLDTRAGRLEAPQAPASPKAEVSGYVCSNPACNLCRAPGLSPASAELILNAGPTLYAGGRPL